MKPPGELVPVSTPWHSLLQLLLPRVHPASPRARRPSLGSPSPAKGFRGETLISRTPERASAKRVPWGMQRESGAAGCRTGRGQKNNLYLLLSGRELSNLVFVLGCSVCISFNQALDRKSPSIKLCHSHLLIGAAAQLMQPSGLKTMTFYTDMSNPPA